MRRDRDQKVRIGKRFPPGRPHKPRHQRREIQPVGMLQWKDERLRAVVIDARRPRRCDKRRLGKASGAHLIRPRRKLEGRTAGRAKRWRDQIQPGPTRGAKTVLPLERIAADGTSRRHHEIERPPRHRAHRRQGRLRQILWTTVRHTLSQR